MAEQRIPTASSSHFLSEKLVFMSFSEKLVFMSFATCPKEVPVPSRLWNSEGI